MSDDDDHVTASGSNEAFVEGDRLQQFSSETNTLRPPPQPVIETYDERNSVVGGTIVHGDYDWIKILQHPDTTVELASSSFYSPGQWYLNLDPNLKSDNYRIIARVFGPGGFKYSLPKDITIVGAPNIETPVEGAVVEGSQLVEISGDNVVPGHPARITEGPVNIGTEIGVSGPADTNGAWTIKLDLSAYDKAFSFRVWDATRNRVSNSSFRKIHLQTIPVIDVPDSGAVTDPRGEISGHGGIPGGFVEVLRDLDHLFKVGQGAVGADGKWKIDQYDNDIPAGIFTAVPRLTYSGNKTIGGPRTFKVLPPALTEVIVTYPTETTVKFSGHGHAGATVDIRIVSGPGGAAPPSVLVKANGEWDTTAENWTPGLYTLTAIQKVPDNANGWIESQPFQFTVNRQLEDPTDVQYTKDYQPVFSGDGRTGATVTIANPGNTSTAAPDATVINGKWSSKSSEVWGPTLDRKVYIRQFLNGQWSPSWVELNVCIPPLAPVISKVDVNGFFVVISGTCWLNADVELTFSDSDGTFVADVTRTDWSFQRAEPFEPDIRHIVAVTQTAAGQTSLAASETFQIDSLIPKPVITQPAPNAEVGRDITVQGNNGLAGATMQLRDVRFGGVLGEPKLLTDDDEWSIDLSLDIFEYTIEAQQTLNERESLPSDPCTFEVVVMPPFITNPKENDDLPRTSTLEGWAMPGGRVVVLLEGEAEPLLTNVAVDNNGRWKAEVTLPVGAKTIWAKQTFEEQTSKDSQPLSYQVVPAKPSIETPTADDHVGRQVVVSGFGEPGDRVAVILINGGRTVLGQGPVLEDRTWSVTVAFDQPGGGYGLVAVASCDGFDSADSLERSVVLGTYVPTIESPAAGRRVSHPVEFKGLGAVGVGEVVSWFNPDVKWAVNISVSGEWHGVASQPLPLGGQWCWFWQTLTNGEEGETVSDWVESKRFEVVPAPSTEPRYQTSDERS